MSDLSVEHVRVPTNGIHLHCAVAGNGPLFLMLHGFPESWRSWSAQMSALAPRFKVVAPDLRGFGDSDKPDDGYDPWTLAEDIAGLIDAFGGGKRAHVVGHNWGGYIAWALSYLHADRLDRLSIVNSPHPFLFRRKILSVQLFRSWYVLFFGLPWLPEWFLRRRGGAGIASVFRLGTGGGKPITEAYLAYAKAEMLKPGAIRAGLEYYRTALRGGKKNILFMDRVTDVPIQMIWGEADRALDVLLLDGLDEYVSYLRVNRLPGIGHWVNHEAGDEVNRLLLDWHAPNEALVA
jgi:pimeloyl-ACP methyl ester carboxylesterase